MKAKIYFDIAYMRFLPNAIVTITDSKTEKTVLYLSNIEDVRKKYCYGKLIYEYGNSIGRYVNGSVFGYADIDLSGSGAIISNEEFQNKYLQAFNHKSNYLQAILIFLWFIKDNSIGVYGTYGEIPDLKMVNGKSRSITNYNCKGLLEDSFFSEDELKQTSDLVTKYSSICGLSNKIIDETNILWEYDDQGHKVKGILPKTPDGFSYQDQTPIDRAIHFLMTARAQNYLIYRIAFYMPILECLFSTQNTDITFRIAARATAYIGKDGKEKEEIFEKINAGYNVRSKFIHGQAIPEKDMPGLTRLSELIDGYIRRVLTKAISVDSAVFTIYSATNRDDYLNALVLGFPFDHEAVMSDILEKERQRKETAKKAANAKAKAETMKPKNR